MCDDNGGDAMTSGIHLLQQNEGILWASPLATFSALSLYYLLELVEHLSQNYLKVVLRML